MAQILPRPKKVLEIGSLQTKNQRRLANMRDVFSGSEYIGVDMMKGPGVDMVANAEKLPFRNGEFDLVICLETLEHAQKPWMVAQEIERVMADNGVAIVSSQQNFPIHLHPSDYFRFTPYGLRSLFTQLKYNFVVTISPPFDNEVKKNPQTVILLGSKKRHKYMLSDVKRGLLSQKRVISVHKPYRQRVVDCLRYFRRGLSDLLYKEEIEFF